MNAQHLAVEFAFASNRLLLLPRQQIFERFWKMHYPAYALMTER